MNALEYAQELIRFDSTWYRSNRQVSEYVEQTLRNLGCETEHIAYVDEEGVDKVNVVARKGEGEGGLAYFGHTDVVTSDDWSIREHGPFEPVVREGRLYGRGSTDMKGSIACMLAALESLQNEQFRRPVYVSCSSDEEVSHRGAIEISQRSQIYRELILGGACGIVGEPTALDVVYAHKGGCRITIISRGKAAHSSTQEGCNANWAMIPFLAEMKAVHEETNADPAWQDSEFDPPTICLNLGVNDHTKAVNITAPQSICTIGFRPMPNTDIESIINRGRTLAEKLGLEFKVENNHPAFRRDPQSNFVRTVLQQTGRAKPKTVGFGSEASNFSEIENLILLGPGDIAQAHKSDEWISLEQLRQGQQTYRALIRQYCL